MLRLIIFSSFIVLTVYAQKQTCQCGQAWNDCIDRRTNELQANFTICSNKCLSEVATGDRQQMACLADVQQSNFPLENSMMQCMKRDNMNNNLGCVMPGEESQDIWQQMQSMFNGEMSVFNDMSAMLDIDYAMNEQSGQQAAELAQALGKLMQNGSLIQYENCLSTCFGDMTGLYVTRNYETASRLNMQTAVFSTSTEFDTNRAQYDLCGKELNCEMALPNVAKLIRSTMNCMQFEAIGTTIQQVCKCVGVECADLSKMVTNMFKNGQAVPSRWKRSLFKFI